MNKKIISVLMCLIIIILSAITVFAQEEEYELGNYKVDTDLLNFREGAGLEHTVITTIPRDTEIVVTEIKDGWGYTEYNGNQGWLMMIYLAFESALESKYLVDWKIIDISQNQTTDINWESVKSEGVDGVILCIGRRAQVSRKIEENKKFNDYYEGAVNAGLYVGAYFYSAAYSNEEAKAEADWVINKVKGERISFNMPVFINMEYMQQKNLGAEICTDMVKTFCNALKEKGIYSGLYCYQWWADELFDMSQFNNYPIWIINYSDNYDYSGSFDMWKKTDSAVLNAISGVVGLSECYTDFPLLMNDLGYIKTVEDVEHIEGEWVIRKEATCSTYGERVLECTHCELDLEFEIIDMTAHTHGEWTVNLAATETEDGERIRKCVNCDLILDRQVISAISSTHIHISGNWVQTTPATCSSHGEEHLLCKDCGKFIAYSIIPRKSHIDGGVEFIEASCTQSGKTATKCAECGEILRGSFIDPLGHDILNWEITKVATSTQKGERVGVCVVCGEEIKEEIDVAKVIIPGDLNGDGNVTSAEARKILRHAVKIEFLTGDELLAADVNADGSISASDARLALRKAVKID